MEEGYKEIELYETKLRVYPNGNVLRLIKVSNQFGKKGEWTLITHINTNGYYATEINGKSIVLHRIIGMVYLGLDITNKTQLIDHKNRIRTDNQIDNLQIVDKQKNAFNRSNVKGYTLNRGKYEVRIIVDKKRINLGSYDTEEEAATAYQNAKLIHHII